MTDPTENEEINEELSTEELNSVSGGGDAIREGGYPGGSGLIGTNGHGTGSGMTRRDYDKRFGGIDRGSSVGIDVGPVARDRGSVFEDGAIRAR